MLIVFQLIFLLFSLIAVANIWQRKMKGDMTLRGAIFWMLVWVAVVATVFFPETITVVANRFGIGRGSDFVIYVAVVVIVFVLFRLHVKLMQIERDITRMVRRDALDEVKKRE